MAAAGAARPLRLAGVAVDLGDVERLEAFAEALTAGPDQVDRRAAAAGQPAACGDRRLLLSERQQCATSTLHTSTASFWT
jgi:hypothetical protein